MEKWFNALAAPHRVQEGPLNRLAATDMDGERLDRFELVAELASGGMATVYLARLSAVAGFQRLYAIKRLHPHLQREEEFVSMFLDEARLAARIHHPHVVSILEVGESSRGYYLVMDYIEGDTLARLLARAAQAQQRLPVDVVVRIVLDILSGLHAAHELKDDDDKPLEVVHRDVSPQNIMVGIDGVTRITDFGVARAAARLAVTRSGQLKGKLAYMAPEQARGFDVDRRADVFAVGIMLWESLAMKRLFKGDGEAETLSRVLNAPIPTLRSVSPTLPAALDAVVMKALEREPDRRFSSALEFADALEKAARSLRLVGAPKDVAACMDSLMGADLTEQRAAVRSWLALSEPSRSKKRDSVTKIEGTRRARSEPSGVSAVHPVPSGDGAPEAPLAQDKVTEPRPEASGSVPSVAGPASGGLPVESTSGAFIPPSSVSASSLSTGDQAAPPSPPRRWWAPILAAGLAGGVVSLIVLRMGGVLSGAAASMPPRAPSPVSSSSRISEAPSPVSSASVSSASVSSVPNIAPSASAAPPSSSLSPTPGAPPIHPATRPVRPAIGGLSPSSKPGAVRPPGAAPSNTIPDDISHNPYR